MEFSLGNYKPEAVKDNDFEMMKGKGHICKVNYSRIEEVEAGERDGEAYEAYSRLKYELEVVSEQYKGRRVWKSVNLDSTRETGKKNKTPIQKLADTFFTLGLEFSDSASLAVANATFADMTLVVSFSKFTPPQRDEMQIHTITNEAVSTWDDEEEPAQKVAF